MKDNVKKKKIFTKTGVDSGRVRITSSKKTKERNPVS